MNDSVVTGITAPLRRIPALLGWTRASYYLLSVFLLTIFLIVCIWWPLAEEVLSYVDWSGPWWLYMDWLLLGIFAAMTLLIMSRANLRADALTVLVGVAGGLVIEAWGTQTNLWVYYTNERPPLWIIPAWPIASLSIDRIVRLLRKLLPEGHPWLCGAMYWLVFSVFYALMLAFVAPTMDKSFTWLALSFSAALILVPGDRRSALLTFAAGSGLGYFLELWGTTRACWTYYTHQTPPLFAVFAHGMATLAFWQVALFLSKIYRGLRRSMAGKKA